MSLRFLDLRGVLPPFDHVLPRPADPGADVHEAVAEILRRVRRDGDEAVVEFTLKFDGVDLTAPTTPIRIPGREIAAALERIDPTLRQALELAYERIVAYHAHEGTPPGVFESGGVSVAHLTRPVARAGVYAPGGRARYPSTVLMCAAPARVAGVADIALCVPPAADGTVDDATLAAAAIAGITEVYRVGGAQAVGAMAYGTATIPRVDVIAGPGNAYVAEAKRQVSGVVGVASAFAGPSEIVVVAGPPAPDHLAEFAAIDLVGAGRTRPGRPGLVGDVGCGLVGRRQLRSRPDGGGLTPAARPRIHARHRRGSPASSIRRDAAMAVANTVAPEHLQIMVRPRAWSPWSRTPARSSSAPGPRPAWATTSPGPITCCPPTAPPASRRPCGPTTFAVISTRCTVTTEALVQLGPPVITLAETEGLPAHADSVRRRLRLPLGRRGARGPMTAIPPSDPTSR